MTQESSSIYIWTLCIHEKKYLIQFCEYETKIQFQLWGFFFFSLMQEEWRLVTSRTRALLCFPYVSAVNKLVKGMIKCLIFLPKVRPINILDPRSFWCLYRVFANMSAMILPILSTCTSVALPPCPSRSGVEFLESGFSCLTCFDQWDSKKKSQAETSF